MSIPAAGSVETESSELASIDIAPTAIIKRMALNNAASIVDFLKPYVRFSLEAVFARCAAPQASNNPSTSLKLCPASASNARELISSPIENFH